MDVSSARVAEPLDQAAKRQRDNRCTAELPRRSGPAGYLFCRTCRHTATDQTPIKSRTVKRQGQRRRIQWAQKKSKASPWTLLCRPDAGGEIVCVGLPHFVADSQHGKSQRHHQRHGKDNRVHRGIISHFGPLERFCYNQVTLVWPLSADGAGAMPGVKAAVDVTRTHHSRVFLAKSWACENTARSATRTWHWPQPAIASA